MKLFRKTRLIILMLCSAVFLTSCSTLSEFIVINQSGSEIEIEYKVKNIQNYEKPRITTAEKALNRPKDWKNIPEENLKIDSSAGTINIKLADGKAVIVAAEVNYLGHDKEEFSIEEITISINGKSLNYSGKQAQKLFKKQENGDYAIIYK